MKITYVLRMSLIAFTISSCNPFLPSFDSDQPDTKNNLYHYEQLTNVKISSDVKELYAFGDELGIDASYYLGFQCDPETILEIINANNMHEDDKRGAMLSGDLDFMWWNTLVA
ncbi:MAG: hypothetical protein AAF741_15735 [Bacteroidota bacterium]